MSQRYDNLNQESHNLSDQDIGENSGYPQIIQPQQFYMPQTIQPINIVSDPGYKVFEAQKQVNKWSWYINIAGWVFIILGGLKIFGGLVGIAAIGNHEVEVQGPEHYEEIELPREPLVFKQLLESASGLCTLLLGLAFRKSAKTPNRSSSWILFKQALVLSLFQFIILLLSFMSICIAFGIAIDKWENMPGRVDGKYTFRSKATGDQFEYYRKGKMGSKPRHKEGEEGNVAIALLFVSIFSIFAIACCCATACTGCILGGVYKFHTVTKELDIIQDLPSVRQINYQRAIPQQVPVFQYRTPQVNPGVARGQVIMVPPHIQS